MKYLLYAHCFHALTRAYKRTSAWNSAREKRAYAFYFAKPGTIDDVLVLGANFKAAPPQVLKLADKQ